MTSTVTESNSRGCLPDHALEKSMVLRMTSLAFALILATPLARAHGNDRRYRKWIAELERVHRGLRFLVEARPRRSRRGSCSILNALSQEQGA